MSKEELLALIEPLSMEDRRELGQILVAQLTNGNVDLADDPILNVLAEIQRQPPLDLPPDFSAQHDHYIHGTPKRQF